jgi:hypothetical protein
MKQIGIIATCLAIAFMLSIFVPAGSNCFPPGPTPLTRKQIREIRESLEFYKVEYRAYPDVESHARLRAILEGDNERRIPFLTPKKKGMFYEFTRILDSSNRTEEFLDGWKVPLVISSIEGSIEIRSLGQDRRVNTEDDIIQR